MKNILKITVIAMTAFIASSNTAQASSNDNPIDAATCINFSCMLLLTHGCLEAGKTAVEAITRIILPNAQLPVSPFTQSLSSRSQLVGVALFGACLSYFSAKCALDAGMRLANDFKKNNPKS